MATVQTFTAGETGLFVNSYLIETESSVLVVDTNLLNADIEALRERISTIGKPVAGIFLTHAHPDHFNGVFALTRHDETIPVYATSAVAQTIREIADAKRAQWGPVYGDQWPARTAYPTVELADGQSVTCDDVTLVVRHIGAAESHADSYFVATSSAGRVAFIGDLAFHGTHPYVADGHSTRWMAALDTLATGLAGVPALYPGHGAPTDATIFTEQQRYLRYYRDQVQELADGAPQLGVTAKQELEARMTSFAPGASLTWMIQLGADAVARELAGGDSD